MKNLLLQITKFIGLSGLGWILDFCIYIVIGFVSGNLAVNNIISSWVGVSFVFAFATRKVFENHSKISLKWKYLIYILYQCILIYFISELLNDVNLFILKRIDISMISQFSAAISKIVITPVTMILNFCVMKGIIEKL